jgi:hypothetical protein
MPLRFTSYLPRLRIMASNELAGVGIRALHGADPYHFHTEAGKAHGDNEDPTGRR